MRAITTFHLNNVKQFSVRAAEGKGGSVSAPYAPWCIFLPQTLVTASRMFIGWQISRERACAITQTGSPGPGEPGRWPAPSCGTYQTWPDQVILGGKDKYVPTAFVYCRQVLQRCSGMCGIYSGGTERTVGFTSSYRHQNNIFWVADIAGKYNVHTQKMWEDFRCSALCNLYSSLISLWISMFKLPFK